jgi:5-bromo-4-chloroindolyl phosphate hydrolysis protein
MSDRNKLILTGITGFTLVIVMYIINVLALSTALITGCVFVYILDRLDDIRILKYDVQLLSNELSSTRVELAEREHFIFLQDKEIQTLETQLDEYRQKETQCEEVCNKPEVKVKTPRRKKPKTE